ncbi:SPOR domain-containing protein [Gorillibacterium sp. CAU 1737]|uniref:SPOR domain-containing protein n=1 Tax=Gorillibacterium sp. CAU 1737 TaxID=3140362 RepID=UPI00325FE700
MNKARLTYRFDRDGTRTNASEPVSPKEPWARKESEEPDWTDTIIHFPYGEEPLPRSGAERAREEHTEAIRRREREAALRESEWDTWEWSDKRKEAPRPHTDAYTEQRNSRDRMEDDPWGTWSETRTEPSYRKERPLPREHSDPIPEETQRIEHLIRESERQTRRESERLSSSDDWRSERSRPDSKRWRDEWEEQVVDDPPRRNRVERYDWDEERRDIRGPEIDDSLLYAEGGRVRRRNLSWMKAAGSLLGALVLGGMLGYYILTLVGGPGPDPADPASDNGAAVVQNDSTVPGGTKTENGGGLGDVTAATAAVAIPERSFYLLQNGKFTTAAAAAAAAKALNGAGFAAATESGDSYYVYAGVAGDRESARILENKLKAGQFEVYAKPYTLPAVSQVQWGGDPLSLQSYLEETNRLNQMMSALTLVHLDEESATPLDSESLASIKKAHQAWAEQAEAVQQEAPESAKLLLQKMDNAVNTAEKSLEAYTKAPSPSLLNQVQSDLMQGLLAEKQLLTAIAGS